MHIYSQESLEDFIGRGMEEASPRKTFQVRFIFSCGIQHMNRRRIAIYGPMIRYRFIPVKAGLEKTRVF